MSNELTGSTYLVTAPTHEPVTVAECREALGISDYSQDKLLKSLITAARIYCEHYLKRQFITATWEYRLDRFPPWEIELPLPPLQSITSVNYVDVGGVTQTIDPANYLVDIYTEAARLTPAYNSFWPTSTRYQNNAVVIRFVAGYGDAAEVPETIKTAIKKHVQMQFDGMACPEFLNAINNLLATEGWGCYV
jgi:uncharacterized phiE125 gp8 family phage protein